MRRFQCPTTLDAPNDTQHLRRGNIGDWATPNERKNVPLKPTIEILSPDCWKSIESLASVPTTVNTLPEREAVIPAAITCRASNGSNCSWRLQKLRERFMAALRR